MAVKFIVTGSSGFIGTNFLNLLASKGIEYYSIDCHTAGSNKFITDGTQNCKHHFNIDLSDLKTYDQISEYFKYKFDDLIVVHFASLSHVDSSIKNPIDFVTKNIQLTYSIAEFCAKHNIPFVNIGTDEIYGELGLCDMPFNTNSRLSPRNPYSASKASGEILIESLIAQYPEWKVLRTRCVNNFGEYQDPTKLIPVCILSILSNKKIPIYGDGKQVRTWIDVKQHNKVVLELIEKTLLVSTCINWSKSRIFNIGSYYEVSNIQLIQKICNIMHVPINQVVNFIPDPRGHAHDFRYALDIRQTENYLEHPITNFNLDERLRETIDWYKQNNDITMWRGSNE